ncbi:MAG: N-acetyltransferase [Pirellulales bacterium]|nr:N-acetyltransferase [Pirellulales bacterium]
MSDLTVIPVSDRADRKRFLTFPWQLYRDDPNWVPPLRRNQEELVGYRRHPFYERNECQTFLAMRGGDVCGRIAAIVNHGHLERYKDERGFFGFFECVEDPRVAAALFDAARQWLADRGLKSVRGPLNPSLSYEVGTLVEGFDSPPTFMMTYNPPYYPRLIEGCGFRKVQDLYAYWGSVEMLPAIQARYQRNSDQILERLGVHLRPLDRSHFIEDVERFLDVFNRSLSNTWGFVPMTPAEVRHAAEGLRHLIVPELALGAEIDGQMAGAVLCLPDYNPRIKRIDGRLFPFGALRLLYAKRRIPRLRILSANVLPEYQLLGVGLVLLSGLVPKAIDWGVREAEFSWILESNALSRGSLEKGGAKRYKTYRIYDLD